MDLSGYMGSERYATAGLLIAANLVPAFGVLLLGWDVFQVMVLYWMESAVIGFYTVLKLLLVEKQLPMRLFNAGFLTVNVSAFMYVHLIFLVGIAGIFVPATAFASTSSVLGALTAAFPGVAAPAIWVAALFAIHGFSFSREFLAGSSRDIMFRQVARSMNHRLFYMHAVLLGAFLLVLAAGPSSTALELFIVAAKFGVDIFLQ